MPGRIEASGALWDQFYERGNVPWRSAGLCNVDRRLIARHVPDRSRFIEVGCGLGDDGSDISRLGHDYTGLDVSSAAIAEARLRSENGMRFLHRDFLKWSAPRLFDALYEKGMFHGLGGETRRIQFLRRAASAIRRGGIWLSVTGSADHRRRDFRHGAIYLRDLVSPAEVYFEILEIIKAPYGLREKTHDFDAWHAVMRRR